MEPKYSPRTAHLPAEERNITSLHLWISYRRRIKNTKKACRAARNHTCQEREDAGASTLLKLHLCGELQRHFLLDTVCTKQEAPWSGKVKYMLPREYLVKVDNCGRWSVSVRYLLLDNNVAFNNAKLEHSRCQQEAHHRNGITVMGIDPGARTAHTVFTSNGQALDLRDLQDKECLQQARNYGDKFRSI